MRAKEIKLGNCKQ